MKFKPGKRVAFYEITAIHGESPRPSMKLGSILIDNMRGPVTTWGFLDTESNQETTVVGTRVGFARVNDEATRVIPEPALQAILDERKAAAEAAESAQEVSASA
ncbi:hypothetical protein [Pseudoclavibacter sp. VKM Ac-2867]|uniref:hypothetical protein n=1 Tax=Pseudoclavibacter sp. VKM Ac-2867 TaxID=2783829 RepID=UPI00188ADC30|nr:hypothetical protein [Pseudoclavibacter sp. VKM Ac-2867]MBF4459507.1 hypothetical protein [Pseudoclavibacter sp. VKM Ac-2867]